MRYIFIHHVLKAVCLLALVGSLDAIGTPRLATASEFVVDASATTFTLSGTINGPDGLRALEPQMLGSLTSAFHDALLIDLSTPGEISFDGAGLTTDPKPGPFQPSSKPADFAIVAQNFVGGNPAYGAIRNSLAFVSGAATPLDSAGSFDARSLAIRLSWAAFNVSAEGLGTSTINNNPMFQNDSAAPATLSKIGDQYRLDIPFHASVPISLGYPATLGLSGEIVAYSPIAHAKSPNVHNGSFEAEIIRNGTDALTSDWSVIRGPGTDNDVAVIASYPALRPAAPHGQNAVFLNVINGTDGIRQLTVPPGTLEANSIYQVKFDLGNRDFAAEGLRSHAAANSFISIYGFFTLGNDGADFSKHVGVPFVLPQFSDVPLGVYLEDRSFFLDTSTLSPEQLAEGLNLVILATSTTDQTLGQVLIDNVRLNVVPEPGALALILSGAFAYVLVVGGKPAAASDRIRWQWKQGLKTP